MALGYLGRAAGGRPREQGCNHLRSHTNCCPPCRSRRSRRPARTSCDGCDEPAPTGGGAGGSSVPCWLPPPRRKKSPPRRSLALRGVRGLPTPCPPRPTAPPLRRPFGLLERARRGDTSRRVRASHGRRRRRDEWRGSPGVATRPVSYRSSSISLRPPFAGFRKARETWSEARSTASTHSVRCSRLGAASSTRARTSVPASTYVRCTCSSSTWG